MTESGTRGLIFNEPVIFEKGDDGRIGYRPPERDFAKQNPSAILGSRYRGKIENMPELAEPEVVRHYTRLSQWNFGVDSGFYPLGSCTMKYNPKVNELVAAMAGFSAIHPLQPDEAAQGALKLIYKLEQQLCDITGMDYGTVQPSAGAQGELCGLLAIRAYHEAHGNPRKKIILPDSSHGTNPASATLCHYESVVIHSNKDGLIDVKELEEMMDEEVAGIMLTNPNTLGLFEKDIVKICEIVHAKGGLVYGDGANLNALLGQARFGDMGIDVCHINLHKTFATPHGGGGPGSGPCLVKEKLKPYLPVPRVIKEGETYRLDWKTEYSVGALHAFHGNFGVLVKAYTYILTLGADGLREISEAALLGANYIRHKLRGHYHIPFDRTCMHECVISDKNLQEHGITTLDVAKALIDKGYHPPTIYFPLIVKGAMMIEPTESESLETIDGFINAMIEIASRAKSHPESIKASPMLPKLKRLDETKAARQPNLVYKPEL